MLLRLEAQVFETMLYPIQLKIEEITAAGQENTQFFRKPRIRRNDLIHHFEGRRTHLLWVDKRARATSMQNAIERAQERALELAKMYQNAKEQTNASSSWLHTASWVMEEVLLLSFKDIPRGSFSPRSLLPITSGTTMVIGAITMGEAPTFATSLFVASGVSWAIDVTIDLILRTGFMRKKAKRRIEADGAQILNAFLTTLESNGVTLQGGIKAELAKISSKHCEQLLARYVPPANFLSDGAAFGLN